MTDGPFLLFGKTRVLESAIDEFLDSVSEGGLVFDRVVAGYLSDKLDRVQEKLDQLTNLESRGDQLRRSIETTLYAEMLIPESRGDVLNLLGDLDELLDRFKSITQSLALERPQVPSDFHDGLGELVSVARDSTEYTVQAARAFFRDSPAIRDHIHKIGYFEAEADAITLRLRQAIFGSELDLAHKIHLREMVCAISSIADLAEDCGDRLTIYAIKRAL